MGSRFTRLEQILGGRVEELTWTSLTVVVEQGAPEAVDVDFKQGHYPNTDGGKRELCKDIAAMANTAGGIILLGIEETDGVAAGFAPLALDEADEQRYRQIVANGVFPLPRFDLLRVADPGDATRGVLVILVPKSPLAPHAVVKDDSLRYPRRHGSTTLYLSEPEVATAYRQRFALGRERLALVAEREEGALERLAPDEPWLVVTLVPDLEGQMVVDRASLRAFQADMVGHAAQLPWYGLTWSQCGAGFRRLWAHGGQRGDESHGYIRWCSANLHSDGSASYAIQLGNRARLVDEGDESETHVDDEAIASTLLAGLEQLGTHAWECGAGGQANIRVRVWAPRNGKRIALTHGRGIMGGSTYAPAVDAPAPAEVVVPLELLYPFGPDGVATAALLLRDVAQTLNVPEVGQLATDGTVRSRYWGNSVQSSLRAWCNERGIRVTEEVLDGV